MGAIKKIDVNSLAGASHREKMVALESVIQQHEQNHQCVLTLHYAHGTLTRELFMPQGALITGKIHRYSCINILAKGKMTVITDDGRYDIEAPYTFVSGAGHKKAIHALEDSVLINVHPWDGKMSIEEIEKELIVDSYEQLDKERGES